MSYAKSIDGLNIEVTTGKVAQSIDSLDMMLSTSEGAVQDGIVLLSPANGEINVSVTPSFDWDSSTVFDAYKILIDADENFSSPIEAYITASNYEQTEALLNATNYHWKVIGGNVTDRPAIVPVVGQDDDVAGDIIALQAFRDSLGGDSWTNTWPATITTDNYESLWGVNTDANGRVIHLDLQRGTTVPAAEGSDPSLSGGTLGNNLVGTLPEEIGNLTKLKYFNVKQNLITGSIPASIGNWIECKRILLSGHTREPEIGDYNHPTGGGAVDGKNVYATNALSGTIPGTVRNLNALEVFESQQNGYTHAGRYAPGLNGQIPHEWGDNLKMLLLTSNQFSGGLPPLTNSTGLVNIDISESYDIEGTLPANWGDFPLKYIKVAFNNISGSVPQNWEKLQDLRVILFNKNNLSGSFPHFLFTDGKNPSINTFRIEGNEFSGSIPEISNIGNRFSSGSFTLSHNNFSGPLPDWFAQISPQHFAIDTNSFTGDLPAGFHDMNAPLYSNLRYIRAYGNQLTGSLPKVNFINPVVTSDVISNDLANKVTTDLDLSVVETGVIDAVGIGGGNRPWFKDYSKDGVWTTNQWLNYQIRINVPNGEDIVYIADVDYPDMTNGAIYTNADVDLSGTVGYTYEISEGVIGRKVMFTKDNGDAVVREVTGTSSGDLVLDSAVTIDLSGYSAQYFNESTNLLYIHFGNNQFSGSIPTEWAGIRTTRSNFYVGLEGNNLSGRVDPEISSISTIDLSSFNVSNNIFTVDDLSDILVRGFTELIYTPQNKVGTLKSILFTQNGQEITIEYYNLFGDASNSYEWFKNNQSIGSGLGPEITITVNESDSGSIIYLEVTNSDVPNLVSVTEDAILELEDTNI